MVFVFASTSGLSLKPTDIFLLAFFPILFSNLASLSDSIFINNIFFRIASFSSSSVFPTPEKTILLGLMPAFKAFKSSPPDTTSAPAPNLPSILIIDKFELALVAKQIRGLVLLKFLDPCWNPLLLH